MTLDAHAASAHTAHDRFSEAAHAVWQHAAAESRRLDHYYIGVEHLFLGLAALQPDLLNGVLASWSLTADRSADAVLAEIGTGPPPDWDRIRLTPRIRAILARADAIRETGGACQIDPLHLWAAIAGEGESIPARTLESLGVDLLRLLKILASPAVGACGGAGSTHPRASLTPCLDRIGKDLVQAALCGSFDPLVGRERELELLMEVLCRRTKNNPVLLGEAGVGKTAIVEGLARRIAEGKVPPALRGMRVVQVTASRLLSGGGPHAEDQVRRILEEVRQAPDVTLFVDEMHTLASGVGVDAAALLKPPLARGEIRCVGATTTAEYRRFVEGEAALERRFQPILVNEPGKDLTLEILRGLRPRYESHHGVTIADEALNAAISLSNQYLSDRQQPDKAIDLMDQSAARVAIRASGAWVNRPEYTAGENGACPLPHVVTRSDVASVVSDLVGMDVPHGGGADPTRLRDLERFLGERILGQDEAVAAVSQVIRVAKRELDLRPFRPDGVILLVGPSGVGKTALAHAVCEFLHGENEDALVRLDMSDYSEPHSLARLVGPPPGYIGYEEEGQLTGRVRTHPNCVLVLDDIDRAHPSVRALFLQVFDEGRLTDSRGRCIHFDHTTIVMTTTTGADAAPAGFHHDNGVPSIHRLNTVLSEELGNDFISRIDRMIPLVPLSMETIVAVAAGMLRQLRDRLAAEGKSLTVESGVAELLAAYHYNSRQGARHLGRALEDLVIEPLTTLSYRSEWTDSPGACLRTSEGALIVELLPCSE
ncbi:MAG TPA: ATP-dependent Clp protease ATP-binding subunit [Armatimonadota bacterium]|nr:ATP-dependent Clp protease ATP-binding subunit [Armatimonadota bacterium]